MVLAIITNTETFTLLSKMDLIIKVIPIQIPKQNKK